MPVAALPCRLQALDVPVQALPSLLQALPCLSSELIRACELNYLGPKPSPERAKRVMGLALIRSLRRG